MHPVPQQLQIPRRPRCPFKGGETRRPVPSRREEVNPNAPGRAPPPQGEAATALQLKLHSQRSVDEEEQHEEEAQISHLERERSTLMMRMMVGLMGSAELIFSSSRAMPMMDSATMPMSSWFHLRPLTQCHRELRYLGHPRVLTARRTSTRHLSLKKRWMPNAASLSSASTTKMQALQAVLSKVDYRPAPPFSLLLRFFSIILTLFSSLRRVSSSSWSCRHLWKFSTTTPTNMLSTKKLTMRRKEMK
ncbi:hypothetical protein EYF80_052668 [Liparis tanakae]|uniref:Uncharacterized protein n=1 Tax=Liparis tanakae TaxID=230148 RepID=A0A4Z2F829_9TELE|nr:hypothetical protein EYF80_052668 [Liparis tanakae]